MSERRHIWTILFGEVSIYQEDNNGDVSGLAIMHSCFFRGFSLSETLENTRRPVFGRAKRKITVRTYEQEASIEQIHISKRLEYDAIKNLGRNAKLRVVFDFTDNAYSGIIPFENDTWELKHARRTKFEITGQDPNEIIASISFSAEDL